MARAQRGSLGGDCTVRIPALLVQDLDLTVLSFGLGETSYR